MGAATPSHQDPPAAPGAPVRASTTARDLRADCSRCFGLCCVALPFTASSDFAFSKAAGDPCRNLLPSFGCSIHERLRETGMRGCTVYDCFGAGQHVAQETFHGRSWRDEPETTAQMFAVFPVMRLLHELLWYLTETADRVAGHAAIAQDVDHAVLDTVELTRLSPSGLEALDAQAHRQRIARVLRQASALIRADAPVARRDHSNADLVGAHLADTDLRGADLRGSLLIGADLRRADLRLADLIGADLRGAELHGANLSTSLFLTQVQVNAAQGDAATGLPARLLRPDHWR